MMMPASVAWCMWTLTHVRRKPNANGKSPRGLRRYVERRDASSAARYETRKYAIFPATSVGFLEAKTTSERLLESVARPQKVGLVNEDNGEKESAEIARKAKGKKEVAMPRKKNTRNI